MCGLPVVLRLCERLPIASESDGALKVYYFPANQLGAPITAVRGFFNVDSIDADTQIWLHGQWSTDGVEWQDVATALNWEAAVSTAGLTAMSRYVPTPAGGFGGTTRFGIGINHDGLESQVSALIEAVDLVLETNGAA